MLLALEDGVNGDPDRDREHGKPLPAVNPSNAGLGGAGPKDGAGCEHGRRGEDGAPGAPGAAGQGGRLTEVGWQGVPGSRGGTGAPGHGGGGGGDAPGGRSACGDAAPGGASGGGGGGAIFAHSGSKLTLRETRVITGRGGAGSRGGRGQLGGQGVQGGPPGEDGWTLSPRDLASVRKSKKLKMLTDLAVREGITVSHRSRGRHPGAHFVNSLA
ncbi:uncharacterized protein SOCEGT47_013900 [Sorangium cellulosum]|uniref:Uncharacterized protein n=1 Tax=Sorangium cellulosum TaxID=56 RepID=A0A4P2PVZ7_SORCE|nr:hypothetical protein [Sorangium cellulosum]AUX20914.1 uncharacterized protein SOCEGT47_013900 [Sorangium cellulosum]